MKVIGKRSAGELIIALILSAIVLPLSIMLSVLALSSTMEGNQNIILIAVPLFTVLYLMYLIITLATRPKELIRYDNDHFYLVYRTNTKTIPISSIVGITPRAARAKGVRYSFGKIIVRTNEGRYAVDGVANVEDVAIEMTLIKEEHKLRDHDL
jgi:hypothetical protein